MSSTKFLVAFEMTWVMLVMALFIYEEGFATEHPSSEYEYVMLFARDLRESPVLCHILGMHLFVWTVIMALCFDEYLSRAVSITKSNASLLGGTIKELIKRGIVSLQKKIMELIKKGINLLKRKIKELISKGIALLKRKIKELIKKGITLLKRKIKELIKKGITLLKRKIKELIKKGITLLKRKIKDLINKGITLPRRKVNEWVKRRIIFLKRKMKDMKNSRAMKMLEAGFMWMEEHPETMLLIRIAFL
eukprot:TRINITY_DN16207_c1_g1_i6.p1 TRINITY_DN16207_c1_g1~~TRINITY_DN16207_c1_g1_i6.p1  ORF type:complete len:267 (+),score=24.44 TRINITY_DN16207_c1_g1_i6:55-801(+)